MSHTNNEAGVCRAHTSGMFCTYTTFGSLSFKFRDIQRLSHLMIIIWQSAIPPTFCTIFLCILYIHYATARQVRSPLSCMKILVSFFVPAYNERTLMVWFLHVEKTRLLVHHYSGDGWQVLRHFSILHNVRLHLYLYGHTIF